MSGDVLGRGIAMSYLSIVALIPLAAVVAESLEGGIGTFWDAVTTPQALASLRITLIASVIVVIINALAGTLIAWVLVRDEFPGKGIVNSLVDLPFALPTIVAGLTLLAFYGPDSPVGINLAYTQASVVLGDTDGEGGRCPCRRGTRAGRPSPRTPRAVGDPRR